MITNKLTACYEEDYNLWTEQMVDLLRARRFEELDIDNLLDELESMSKRDKREILSRLKLILMHVLKWNYQPDQQSASWEKKIRKNREEIAQILQDSPSLKSYVETVLDQAYASARKNAASETGLLIDEFPENCPFAIAEILNEDFLPAEIVDNF